MSSWLEDARRVTLEGAAAELGIERTRDGHLSPCPSCGERTRSRTDDRLGPVFVIHQGRRWKCGRCEARGDVLDLVSFAELGRAMDSTATGYVRSWFAIRGWCEAAADEPVERRAPRPPPAPPPEREPAPPDQVAALWSRCGRVSDAPEVAAWLRSRALDPALVEERDLVRVLPRTGALPPWAGHWRGPRHLCPVMVPLWGASGELVGLQGRRVDDQQPKAVTAFNVRRVGIYADPVGRALLQEGDRPRWWQGALVIIAEGEPDFLTWATRYPDPPQAPAVLGIPGSGGWSAEVAARVPSGVTVIIRTHVDGQRQNYAGQRYAGQIAESLWPRCAVRVLA